LHSLRRLRRTAWSCNQVAALLLLIPAICLITPAWAAPRVVTLTPHATEMVFAAGGGDMIVATVNASDFPEQARHIPRFGDGIHTSLEEILRWEPDLIVSWPSLYTDRLQQLGKQVLLSRPTSLDEIASDIERIGLQLGTLSHARETALALREEIRSLSALTDESQSTSSTRAPGRTSSRSSPTSATPASIVTVVVLASADGQVVMGADPLINQVIELCGGTNPFGSSQLITPRASLEGIISTHPALIVSGSTPAASIKAVAPVRLIDPDWMYRPGPRFVLAARQLCKAIETARHETSKTDTRPDQSRDYSRHN